VVPQFNFITPAIIRKAGTASLSYNPTATWNLNALYWREKQSGVRPIGLIMNSSPSASATSGYGVELPEPINYYNNLVRVGTEYGKRTWAFQAAYIGSFLENHTGVLVWDNPFRLTNEMIANPLSGRMDLYPSNHANYLSFAGATDVSKYLRFIASITPDGCDRTIHSFLIPSTPQSPPAGMGRKLVRLSRLCPLPVWPGISRR